MQWECRGRRNSEGRGGEAAKEKEKWGGDDDTDLESRITGIDSDPLATRAARKDPGKE